VSLSEAITLASGGREVDAATLETAFGEIMDGKASPVKISALLIALRTKGETVGEIVAAARALQARAQTANCADPRAIDTCGTGGDGADTFNVSTAAAFVAAGAGVPVAKHGNVAASSRSGSIDVLRALGVNPDFPIEEAPRILAETGIVPLFAKRAHPAMRFVAPVRQELGLRTVMNCLGPLLNPLGVRRQRLEGGAIRELSLDPARFGVPRAKLSELAGGDPEDNARIVREILAGESGPRRDIVAVNAGAALWVAGAASDLEEGTKLACRSIDSGAARERLESLARVTAALD
jgi:anthranilate phosphoribosyltransferase